MKQKLPIGVWIFFAWLACIIIVSLLSVVSLFTGFSQIAMALVLYPGPLNLIIPILELMYTFSVIGFIIYIGWALYEFQPNAISLVNFFLILMFVTTTALVIMDLLVARVAGEFPLFDATDFVGLAIIFWWFNYFRSKTIKNAYPLQERKSPTTDKAIFLVLLCLFIADFSLMFIGFFL